jgi:hypothetical protein
MERSRSAYEASRRFIAALESTPDAIAQSRLLNTKDRDIAAILAVCSDEEREGILVRVGPGKAQRLRGEITRMRHVRLDADTIARIADHLVSHLKSERPLGPASRFFRPVQRG